MWDYLGRLQSPNYGQAIPNIRKKITIEEFPFIEAGVENLQWSEADLRDQITSLGIWEYYFPFSYGLTTQIAGSFNDGTKIFHRYRAKLINETISDLLGPDLPNCTVLDLACHCGVMGMDMAFRGAKHVTGIEYREKNLAQANFIKDYYRIHNITFEQGDVYELTDAAQPWDVVMCLGILYHVVRPIELIEYVYRNCSRFAVVDTVCHKDPVSAYRIIRNKNVNVSTEGTRSIEFQPTYRAVLDTMEEVGFKNVVEVLGECDTQVSLYKDHSRCCFIGFK